MKTEEKVALCIGKKFGTLLVLGLGKTNEWREKLIHVQCDCGRVYDVRFKGLVNGKVTNCGCLRSEKAKRAATKHGLRFTRIYRFWGNMKNRTRVGGPERYGGRGIRTCPEWMEFKPFHDWAVSNGYSDSLSLERIDINKGYSPENCKWIPLEEQAKNRNTTIWVGGKCLTDFCREQSASYSLVRDRLKANVPLEVALKVERHPGVPHKKVMENYTQ